MDAQVQLEDLVKLISNPAPAFAHCLVITEPQPLQCGGAVHAPPSGFQEVGSSQARTAEGRETSHREAW
jgi:hypothetical protein